MARASSARFASLVVAFAFVSWTASARAQGGDPDDEEESQLGPERRELDEARRDRIKGHVPRPPELRHPSPPDGPDQDPDGGRGSAQCESSIAIDPNDEQHVVGVAIDLNSGSPVTRWYTTFDGGLTWTTGSIATEPGYVYNGDCVVVVTPNGIPVIATLQYFGPGGNGVFAYSSLDGGLTWNPGVPVDVDVRNDKVQAATDLSGGPNHGQIAVAWDRFLSSHSDQIWAAVSDDDGATFQHVQRVDDTDNRSYLSPDVAYGPNSELWIMWTDHVRFDLFVDRSTDGGATWGTDIKASSYVKVPSPLPGSFFRVFDVFSIAVDWTGGPYSGNVYVLFHRWERFSPLHADVVCLRSEDGGASWQKSNVNVGDTTNADQVMPFAQVDEHGNVNVAFYDRRLDPNNYLLWTWVARSSDGGRSWKEFPGTDVGWDHAATESPGFIGDYLGFDNSSHASRFFSADGRSGSIDVVSDEMHLDLYTDVDDLSASTGGAVQFTLNVGPNEAGADYWLLGSFATDPGIDVGGVHLPLVYDALFVITLQSANTALLQNSRGTLDATGSATITLDSGGPFSSSLVGTDLSFAALVWDQSPVYATNATKVSIVP